MGHNATVVVMTDCLDQIKNDPNFGKNLAAAVSKLSLPPEYRGGNAGVSITAGNCYTSAVAVEVHHADYDTLIAVGNNQGKIVSHAICPNNNDEPANVQYLRALAESLGYYIRKKPTRK